MILLDTNVIIDARTKKSPFHNWAENLIASALAGEGAGVNAIVLAELCVGHTNPRLIETELTNKGVNVIDLPAAAAVTCGRAYTEYKLARRRSAGGEAPTLPLPDFFIGAHAELMDWPLATRDLERFRLYFPNVKLLSPP